VVIRDAKGGCVANGASRCDHMLRVTQRKGTRFARRFIFAGLKAPRFHQGRKSLTAG
jgi:hypothetical protein